MKLIRKSEEIISSLYFKQFYNCLSCVTSDSSLSRQALLESEQDTKSAVWGWIRDVTPRSGTPDDSGSGTQLLDDATNISSRETVSEKVTRKPSFKKRLRPLGDLKKLGPECVGVLGSTPLIPSPSHLTVAQCYELLASPPLGAVPIASGSAAGVPP